MMIGGVEAFESCNVLVAAARAGIVKVDKDAAELSRYLRGSQSTRSYRVPPYLIMSTNGT
jgi:hypothetical protein